MSKTKVLLAVVLTAAISSAVTFALTTQQQQRTRREPQFENEYVKSWKSVILPNQPLSLHRHENGRALIALTDGTLKVIDEEGETIDTYVWEAGKAYWLDKDPPGKLHGDLNEGPDTIEVIVVELKN